MILYVIVRVKHDIDKLISYCHIVNVKKSYNFFIYKKIVVIIRCFLLKYKTFSLNVVKNILLYN